MGWGWGCHIRNNMKVYGNYIDEMVGKCSLRNFSRKDKNNFNIRHAMHKTWTQTIVW